MKLANTAVVDTLVLGKVYLKEVKMAVGAPAATPPPHTYALLRVIIWRISDCQHFFNEALF